MIRMLDIWDMTGTCMCCLGIIWGCSESLAYLRAPACSTGWLLTGFKSAKLKTIATHPMPPWDPVRLLAFQVPEIVPIHTVFRENTMKFLIHENDFRFVDSTNLGKWKHIHDSRIFKHLITWLQVIKCWLWGQLPRNYRLWYKIEALLSHLWPLEALWPNKWHCGTKYRMQVNRHAYSKQLQIFVIQIYADIVMFSLLSWYHTLTLILWCHKIQ